LCRPAGQIFFPGKVLWIDVPEELWDTGEKIVTVQAGRIRNIGGLVHLVLYAFNAVASRSQRCYADGSMGTASRTRTHDIQLFRDVFNASPIGIAVETLEGQPLFVNAAFCSMLGFSEEELRNKHCVDFSPPQDAQKDWVLFQQLRAGSIDHYQLEKRYYRKDGSLVWGSLSVSLLNSRLSPLVIAMVEDITDKKRAEEARFRHAAIVQSSEDAIISKDLDAVIVSWNAGAQRIFGYTESEAVGQPITILIPPELWDEENQILENLRAGGSIEHYETTRITKAGKKVAVSLTISPIKDSSGRLLGFCKLAHDITERGRAEKVLQETNRALQDQTAVLRSQEELLKIFVKHVPAAVAMLDRDMRYLQVSDRWRVDFSLDSSQLLGRSHYEVFPDIPDQWKELHRRALAGEMLRADEDRWDREGGTTWLRWEIRPWQDPDGLQGGVLIFSEDITHLKHAEEVLLGMSRKLIEAHEQERTRIGRDLHDDIVQRLALLAAELEGVQHDLAPELSQRMDDLRNQATQITNDVQLLSHELHSAKLEYLGIVGAIKNFCKEYGDRQKLEIHFTSHDLPTAIPGELSLSLFRVLQEALRNATKHSGVKSFEVRLWGTPDEIHLTVMDSGAGFDSAAARQGRGIGLVSMEERLKLLKGTLAIESQPMRGTTIHARVPFTSSRDSALAAG
jgi:PAS domain S-box-containing protein